MTKSVGKVYLVGAGPGDPGLLTVKAKTLLECADVVVYDALVSPEIVNIISPHAEQIHVSPNVVGVILCCKNRQPNC